MPNINAKNITARMSFPLIAEMKLEGTMLTSACTPVADSPALATIALALGPEVSSSACAVAGSTPAPGCSRLTTARLIATAMDETTTV